MVAPMGARYFVIRDAVHGDVYLTQDEGRLLDTREMQRLRGVRQLGLAHLVYPGARHSRFEHSVGTLHMAQALINSVNRNAELWPGECRAVAAEHTRLIRAAALLHDVTHIPFGHNIEDQSAVLARHDVPERFAAMLAATGELGAELERQGLRQPVLDVLCEADGASPAPAGAPPFVAQMISDTICSDLMDYLRRDAYFTGLNLHYDARIADYFKVDRDRGRLFVDCAKDGLVREDIVSEILRMLQARYYFSERVYYHHAKIAAGAMVARVVETCLRHGWIRPDDLWMQTDEGLLIELRRRLEANPDLDAVRCVGLLDRLQARRLYKRVSVFPYATNVDVQASLIERFFAPARVDARRAFEVQREAEVRERFGLDVDVLFYCPNRKMQLKEAGTLVRFPGEQDLRPLADFRDRVPRIADLEASYLRLWKAYVLTSALDPAVRKFLQERTRASLAPAVDSYRGVK